MFLLWGLSESCSAYRLRMFPVYHSISLNVLLQLNPTEAGWDRHYLHFLDTPVVESLVHTWQQMESCGRGIALFCPALAVMSYTVFHCIRLVWFESLNLPWTAIHCENVCHVLIRFWSLVVEECVKQTVSDPTWPLAEQWREDKM